MYMRSPAAPRDGRPQVDALARRPDSVPISCSMNLGLDHLLARTWRAMDLRRIYTKKVGGKPDFEEPVMLSEFRGGLTVEAFCGHLHRDLHKARMSAPL